MHKRSLRNYLLDARLQLRWTARVLVVAIGISGVLGVFLYRTSREVTEQSERVLAQGEELIRESKKNSDLVRMQIREQYTDAPELAASFDKSAEALDAQLLARRAALAEQGARTRARQRTMIVALFSGLSLLVLLVGLLGIFFTHKVVGPLHKMKRLLRLVGEGRLTFEGRLRRGDDLHDFFEAFSEMVTELRARRAAELDALESALEEARSAGAGAESLAALERLRDELAAALER